MVTKNDLSHSTSRARAQKAGGTPPWISLPFVINSFLGVFCGVGGAHLAGAGKGRLAWAFADSDDSPFAPKQSYLYSGFVIRSFCLARHFLLIQRLLVRQTKVALGLAKVSSGQLY